MKDKITTDDLIKCILICWGMGFAVGILVGVILWK